MSATLFSKCPDIDQAVSQWKETPDFVLLDVRTPQEYRGGHIPGSINVPLSHIGEISAVTENKETVLYVYCHSGMRSRQAVETLQQMGYVNACNIGGIANYTGKVTQ